MLRVVSIAAVLGALVTLAAEHRTQAQNVPGVIRRRFCPQFVHEV